MSDVVLAWANKNKKFTVLCRSVISDTWFQENSKVHGIRKYGSSPYYFGKLDVIGNLLESLKEANLSVKVDKTLKEELQNQKAQLERQRNLALKRFVVLPKEGFRLYPFQVEDALKMSLTDAILCSSEMGTGKTPTSLMALPTDASVLIVCPKSMLSSWNSAVTNWRTDLSPIVVKSKKDFTLPKVNEAVICSYTMLPLPSKHIKNDKDIPSEEYLRRWKVKQPCIIADEFHYVKNSQAARSIGLRCLMHHVLKVGGKALGLTGTPITNKPPDLWTLLMHLDLTKEVFGDWPNFMELLGGRYGEGIGTEWSAAVDHRVPNLLAPYTVRRQLRDVWDEMPESRFEILQLDNAVMSKETKDILDSVDAYLMKGNPDEDETIKRLNDLKNYDSELSAKFVKLRSELAKIKYDGCLEHIEAYEEAGVPLVLASAHRYPVEAAGARPGWTRIEGSISSDLRTKAIEDFQAGKLKGIAITIQAGGVGITLTHGSHMLFIDQTYSAAENEQMQARIMRIGQKNNCLYQLAALKHPLEYRLAEILRGKKHLMVNAIENTAKSNLILQTRQDRVNKYLSQLEEIVGAESDAPKKTLEELRKSISIQNLPDNIKTVIDKYRNVSATASMTDNNRKILRELCYELVKEWCLSEIEKHGIYNKVQIEQHMINVRTWDTFKALGLTCLCN